jgi:hypothetical protein
MASLKKSIVSKIYKAPVKKLSTAKIKTLKRK